MDAKQLATVMGVVRAGVGASLVAAPGWAGRIWVGGHADGPGTKVFARALGARDVLLGSTILAAGRAADETTAARLVKHGVGADVADVIATLIAGRHLVGARRILMPLIAGAVGAAGALIWKLASEQDTGSGYAPDALSGPAAEAGVVDPQGEALVSAGLEPAGAAG